MREILFRGKAFIGEWVDGSLIIDETNNYYIGKAIMSKPSESMWFLQGRGNGKLFSRFVGIGFAMVIPETVGEFTGLYNGGNQKIFEDDIVRFEGELYRVRREDETPGGIWSSTAYILQKIGWDVLLSFEDTIDDYSNEICVEIVGNIHDNPELLN